MSELRPGTGCRILDVIKLILNKIGYVLLWAIVVRIHYLSTAEMIVAHICHFVEDLLIVCIITTFLIVQIKVCSIKKTIWVATWRLLVAQGVLARTVSHVGVVDGSCASHHVVHEINSIRMTVWHVIEVGGSPRLVLIVTVAIDNIVHCVNFSERMDRCAVMLTMQTQYARATRTKVLTLTIVWNLLVLISEQDLITVLLSRGQLFGNLELSLSDSQMACGLQKMPNIQILFGIMDIVH